jgi:hypothetical protein
MAFEVFTAHELARDLTPDEGTRERDYGRSWMQRFIEKHRQPGPASVYFISAEYADPWTLLDNPWVALKVGVAKRPDARLANLQVGNPMTLYLNFAMTCADAYEVERIAHARFPGAYMSGEWRLLSRHMFDGFQEAWLATAKPEAN